MVMYNAIEWLEYHTNNLNLIKTPLFGVTLGAPTLYKYKKLDVEKLIQSMFIDIFYLDNRLFCLDIVDVKKKTTQ